MDGTAIVITAGYLDDDHAKTAHGLIRDSSRYQILGVIDHKFSGKDAGEFLDGKHRGIPIEKNVKALLNVTPHKPDYCIVGIATSGGKLTDELLEIIEEAITLNISIVNGLHEFLEDSRKLTSLANEYNVALLDIRKPRPKSELSFWSGKINEVQSTKIAVLGTDCAVGKRTTARFLVESLAEEGQKAEMIYTGQTGWLQGGKYGFIFDSTVNDFISGEIEYAIHSCYINENPDFIFIEGQSALRNPSGPCGSEFLVSGKMDGVILQHQVSRIYYGDLESWGKIPNIKTEIDLIKIYGVPTLAVTLNTNGLTREEAFSAKSKYEKHLKIPVYLPLFEGVETLSKQIIAQFKK